MSQAMQSSNDKTYPHFVMNTAAAGMISGVRVVEFADELAEYCGLLLSGLGAEVIKIEPPGGNETRSIGPFLEDIEGPDRSLHFWAYNRGKRSVSLDIEDESGRLALMRLLDGADILVDSSCGKLNRALGLDREALCARFPALIVGRMTPFGDTGPWRNYRGCDLVHLALGGIMMNCGYDPNLSWKYDLPPIAPQVWHAYHIAGEQLAVGILAALLHRERTGEGQDLSCSVHECVAKNTELDLMSWVMRRASLWRLTCRHAVEAPNHSPSISHTKDGRWLITHGVGARDLSNLVPFLNRYKMAADLKPPATGADLHARNVPGSAATSEESVHMLEVIQRFVLAHTYEDLPWREAQDAGLLWAPLRKPHENAMDEHWLKRGTFSRVSHPEIGSSFVYPTSKWLSTATVWQVGQRAPLAGEHTKLVLSEQQRKPSVPDRPQRGVEVVSARGKPFPLKGVRILDFSWFLASAGGTRFLAALGAESLKVEWKENPDTRLAAMAPIGGRAARKIATGPIPGVKDPDMGGQFNNKNAGKRGLSLNIRHPRGLEIAKELVKISDVVAEGFSPGVLARLGLGYDVMKGLKPDIIYIQQSGMGGYGTYGRIRTVGPVAAAFAGTSEMSGLPEPAMPAGWGYSYLDWIGAYSFALAILGALFYRERTGEGQWIDASQCESGIFLNAVPVLDWSANKRIWRRFGNRSPYKKAAPHGAYRCKGEDRWIAIACFDDMQWSALCGIAGFPKDERLASLESRIRNQDILDTMLSEYTKTRDAQHLMTSLQAVGVPAGVCQTAEDRCEIDPQLMALEWLTEVTGTKIGRWPVIEFPVKFSRTPPYSGGLTDRGAPCYGEDNEHILTTLLGFTPSEVRKLSADNII